MFLYNLLPARSGPLLKGKVHTRVCSHLEISETILDLLGGDSCSKTKKGKNPYNKLVDY